MPGPKDDFKFRIVLPEKTFQIAFQHRFHPVQGLQYTDKRQLRYGLPFTSRFSAEPSRRYEGQKQIDGAREESQNRADEKYADHERLFVSRYFPPLAATTWTVEAPIN